MPVQAAAWCHLIHLCQGTRTLSGGCHEAFPICHVPRQAGESAAYRAASLISHDRYHTLIVYIRVITRHTRENLSRSCWIDSLADRLGSADLERMTSTLTKGEWMLAEASYESWSLNKPQFDHDYDCTIQRTYIADRQPPSAALSSRSTARTEGVILQLIVNAGEVRQERLAICL